MEKLTFTFTIKASAKKVWTVLWTESFYRQWAAVFHEGSYAVSDWKEGSKVQFLIPSGDGIHSIISVCQPNEKMVFKHVGELKNFAEQASSDAMLEWFGAYESYELKEENGYTTLVASMDATEEIKEYFNGIFPLAMAKVKELAEQPIVITVAAEVEASLEKTWDYWTLPEHITHWNFASPDWHAPKAENDLRVGGKFLSRMEAKDGSFGFDFEGLYTEVELHKKIAYVLGDNRRVSIEFSTKGNNCLVTEAFDAEEENAPELQQGGWQAIMNNFKHYVETN